MGVPTALNEVTRQTSYVHTDGLRSAVAETDETGVVTGRTRYEPYGAPTSGEYVQGPGYAGHVMDAATQLVYMQQRYYDPIAGRFLSTDPVEASPASFNRYWYANNNPYRFIDPDGRFSSLKDHPALKDGVRTFYVNTSEKTASGSVVETRHLVSTSGVAEDGRIDQAGKIERLPQGSDNGKPAFFGEKIKTHLFNFSEKKGVTVEVTSGQRTVAQNNAVGGAPRSQHLQNNAADIRIAGYTPAQTADAAFASGEFNRVNEYSNGRGVHVDLKSSGAQGRFYDWNPQP